MNPPLTPDADEARRQLAEELSKPIYADPGGWLTDMVNRLINWLSGEAPSSTGGLSQGQLGAIILVAVALIVIIVWSVLGPIRRRARSKAPALFVDEERSAGEMRTDASALAAANNWSGACLALFRAMIRTLAEKGTIEESPGMTAHEATERAAERLPDFTDRLESAAQLFDSLAYGRGTATSQQYQTLQNLDAEVITATPIALAAAAEPVPVTVEAAS